MKKFLISLCLVLGHSSFAKEVELNTNSKIMFNVDYMKVSSVDGLFKVFSGSANIDAKESQLSQIKVSIKANSVDTDDPKRDFHVRDHEFFFVSKYPSIEFNSTEVVSIAPGRKFDVKGFLLLRGVKRPIVFQGLYKGKMMGPDKKEIYFFEFTGELNRKDFGMTWNKALDNGGYLVGDVVRLKINAQAD